MNIIAIIPARGGSKGLPLKNIRPLNGVPLVATSILAAKQSKYINSIYVSTDNDDIKSVSIKYGAHVIERPADISGDTASSESALIHVIKELEKQKIQTDLIVFLQCTAPFLTAQDIDGTIDSLLKENADSALAVVPFHHFLWEQGEDGAKGINHDGLYRKRRQDLKPQYLEAGSVYVMKTDCFLEQQTRFCGKTVLYEIDDPSREHEIDDASEFYIAECKSNWFKKSTEERESYRLLTKNFSQKIKNIKAIIFDFDGVFTDNCVYVDENGREMVKCSRGDGLGVSLLKKKANLKLLVVSTEENQCVSARCKKLGLDVKQNCSNKLEFIESWCKEQNLSIKEIMYCGNDLNDACMLGKVGFFACPNNAHEYITKHADYVADKDSLYFVRQISDLIINNL